MNAMKGTRDKDLFQTCSAGSGNRFLPCAPVSPILNSSLVVTDGNGQKDEDVLLLEEEAQMYMQALNGFIIVIQNDGQIFYASPSVQEYLGFQDADIMHQNVFELIHKEDRDDFQKQLLLCPPTSTCSQEVAQRVNGSTDDSGVPPEINDVEPTLDRNFTSRLRCLLDESSGFLSLQFGGRLRMLHGQRTRGKDGIPIDVEPPEMALFALASPLQQPTIMEIYVRNMIFRTKHKLDFKTVNLDAKGSEVLGYSENEFRSLPGYQYIHYEDIIYCSEMHSSLIRKGETGFIYFRLMSKQMKWVWVQAKGRVMYKNGKPDYLVSTHRPMSDEEGEQHLMNRRKPFRWPFAGKAELYECNPPYPPIPQVILQALQRGEIPSFGGGPPPGVSMGDMPPGMAGMPPGMPPGMNGMPPGMGGIPPGMGGMPPGMPPGIGGMPPGIGDFPPSGMPPFGGNMPFRDDGPPPFGINKDSMYSPRSDRGGTPSFDPTNTRIQFKSSPGYSPPTYPCEGMGSDANDGINDMFEHKDWQEINRNRSFLENGIKGHISPEESMPSMELEASRTELTRNLNDGSMNSMTESHSWTMNNMPSNHMREQQLQGQDQPLQHIPPSLPDHMPDHALKTSNMCSPRSTGSNDSGFSSGQNIGSGCNVATRKVAVVSPCQASPVRHLLKKTQDARAPTLSTGSLDSGVDNLPFENGEDIPTFDEALSLSTFDLEQQGALAETLLLGSGKSAASSWAAVNNGQLYNTQNQEFNNMPNQIGPKVESNTMHFNQESNVLRSLLSNHQTQVSCKQEMPNASSPITSATHPNTVEWRSAASKAPVISQNSVQTRQQPVSSHPQSNIPLMQGSVPPQQMQHEVPSSVASGLEQQLKHSQQPNQPPHLRKSQMRIQQTTAGGQHHLQQPPIQAVSNTPNPYNSPGLLPESGRHVSPIQSRSQQLEQQVMQEQRQQLQQLHIHQQQQHQLQQQHQSLQPSGQQNGAHFMANTAEISPHNQQPLSQLQQNQQQQQHVQQQQQHNRQQQQHMERQQASQLQHQQQQIEQHQQQSVQAQRLQNLVQEHTVAQPGLQKEQLHYQKQQPHLQQVQQQRQKQIQHLHNQQQQIQQKQQQHLYQQQQLQQHQLQNQFDHHQQQFHLQQQQQSHQQNFSLPMTNLPVIKSHVETKHSHFIPSHNNMQMDSRSYLENQTMMPNGGNDTGLHVNQDLSLSAKHFHPSTQPDLSNSNLVTPDLTTEFFSSMLPGVNGQSGADKQDLYELPMKGLGSTHLIQNSFQPALTPSSNM